MRYRITGTHIIFTQAIEHPATGGAPAACPVCGQADAAGERVRGLASMLVRAPL